MRMARNQIQSIGDGRNADRYKGNWSCRSLLPATDSEAARPRACSDEALVQSHRDASEGSPIPATVSPGGLIPASPERAPKGHEHEWKTAPATGRQYSYQRNAVKMKNNKKRNMLW